MSSNPHTLLDEEDMKLLPWHIRWRIQLYVGVATVVLLLVAIIAIAVMASEDDDVLNMGIDAIPWSIFVFGRITPSVQRLRVGQPNMSATPTPMRVPRADSAAVYWQGYIYVIGGEQDGNMSKGVDIYNPASDSWSVGPSLRIAREEHVAVVLNNSLVVCGCDLIENVGCLHTCEYLSSPDAVNWTIAWSPACAMYSAAVVHHNRMYIIGSWCIGRGREVHVYDVDSKVWYQSAPLLVDRAGHAAVAMPDRILVCGGSDGPSAQRASCETFDFVTGEWRFTAPMLTRRNNLDMVLVGTNMAFAVGGYPGGGKFSDTIEEYDARNNSWRICEARLAYPIWKHSAVAVPMIS